VTFELENLEGQLGFFGIRVEEASIFEIAHRGKDAVSAAGHLQRRVFSDSRAAARNQNHRHLNRASLLVASGR
jgi:hypothetical protein